MSVIEPNLPWVEGREDRLFKRLVVAFVIVFLLLGLLLNSLTLPEVKQKRLEDIAPRLAKLILEKKKTPPPPPLKKVIKKQKPEAVADSKPKPVPVADTRAAARKTAQKSGLIALSDELADLRESFDFSDIADQAQQKTGKQEETVISTSELLLAKASKASDGVKVDTVSRRISSTELQQRTLAKVSSTIDTADSLDTRSTERKQRSASRNQEEIERVFQKNKGAIFSIYNRELRKDPSLQGKVVVELTIAPDGSVTKCIIVSSELGHSRLEKRLLSKIRKFRFSSKAVPEITVTYPIDFLPS